MVSICRHTEPICCASPPVCVACYTEALRHTQRAPITGAPECYLAEAALFGVTTFQWRRICGTILAVAILLFLGLGSITGSGRRSLRRIALLVALTVVQVSLRRLQTILPALVVLHVVNAGILLGLAGTIARSTVRRSEQIASSGAVSPLASNG